MPTRAVHRLLAGPAESLPPYAGRLARWRWRLAVLMWVALASVFIVLVTTMALGYRVPYSGNLFPITWMCFIAAFWVLELIRRRTQRALQRSPEPPCPGCGYTPGVMLTCPECGLEMTVEQRRECWHDAMFDV